MTLDRNTKPHDHKSQNDCSRTSSLDPSSVLSFPDGRTD